MNIFKDLFLLEWIDCLIRQQRTGSPRDLSQKIGASERKAERLIAQLRDQGFPISFDKRRNTYYYTEDVKIRFEIVIKDDALLRIQGGCQNNFQFFFKAPFSGGEE